MRWSVQDTYLKRRDGGKPELLGSEETPLPAEEEILAVFGRHQRRLKDALVFDRFHEGLKRIALRIDPRSHLFFHENAW